MRGGATAPVATATSASMSPFSKMPAPLRPTQQQQLQPTMSPASKTSSAGGATATAANSSSSNSSSALLNSSLSCLSWLTNLSANPNCLQVMAQTEAVSAAIHDDVDDLDALDIDWSVEPNRKPPFAYVTLIYMALRESDGKLALSEIYNYISSNFAYYRQSDQGWKNSVRHNLSQERCFIKVERDGTDRGKGGFWALNPDFDDFDHIASKKRRQFKNRPEDPPAATTPTGASGSSAAISSAATNTAVNSPARRKNSACSVTAAAASLQADSHDLEEQKRRNSKHHAHRKGSVNASPTKIKPRLAANAGPTSPGLRRLSLSDQVMDITNSSNANPHMTRAKSRRESEVRMDLLLQLETLMGANQEAARRDGADNFVPPTPTRLNPDAAATTVVGGVPPAAAMPGLSARRDSLRLSLRRPSQIDPLSLSSIGLGDLAFLNGSQRLQSLGDFGTDDELRLSFYFSNMEVDRGLNTLMPTTPTLTSAAAATAFPATSGAAAAGAATSTAATVAMPSQRQTKTSGATLMEPTAAGLAQALPLPMLNPGGSSAALMLSLDKAAMRDAGAAMLLPGGLRASGLAPPVLAVNKAAMPRRTAGDDIDDSDQPMPSDWL